MLQRGTADNFCPSKGPLMHAEISTDGAYGLTSLVVDGVHEECLPPQHR